MLLPPEGERGTRGGREKREREEEEALGLQLANRGSLSLSSGRDGERLPRSKMLCWVP